MAPGLFCKIALSCFFHANSFYPLLIGPQQQKQKSSICKYLEGLGRTLPLYCSHKQHFIGHTWQQSISEDHFKILKLQVALAIWGLGITILTVWGTKKQRETANDEGKNKELA